MGDLKGVEHEQVNAQARTTPGSAVDRSAEGIEWHAIQLDGVFVHLRWGRVPVEQNEQERAGDGYRESKVGAVFPAQHGVSARNWPQAPGWMSRSQAVCTLPPNGVRWACGKKNFLGTFAPPVAVLNDADFLRTLPDRDWRSGISEAIKVALLKDAEFFDFIEKKADRLVDRDMQVMLRVIYRCAQLHLDHIARSGDPFEFGSSRPLDFGHWAAHKLEQLSHYTLRHGEAVAIGIALDSTYSYLKELLPERDWERILELLSALRLAVYARELSLHLCDQSDTRCIFTGLQEFKEHLGGQLTLPLLERIGSSVEVNEVDKETMIRSMALLEEYQSAHT